MEITLLAQTINILKSAVLLEVTSETINKVYDPNDYTLSKEELLRTEFSLIPDEKFWFNKYLRDAVYEVSETIKSLNKSEMPSYQIDDITISTDKQKIQFLVTVSKEYNISTLKDLCTSVIVSKIVASWYRMKNKMELYAIYFADAENGTRKLKSISTSGVMGATAKAQYGNITNRHYNIGFGDGFRYLGYGEKKEASAETEEQSKFIEATNIKAGENIHLEVSGKNVTINSSKNQNDHKHENKNILDLFTEDFWRNLKLFPGFGTSANKAARGDHAHNETYADIDHAHNEAYAKIQHEHINNLTVTNIKAGRNVSVESTNNNVTIHATSKTEMEPDYSPVKNQDIATKKYILDLVNVLISEGYTVHKGTLPMPFLFKDDIYYNKPILEEGMVWKKGDYFLSADGLNLFRFVEEYVIYDVSSITSYPIKLINGSIYEPILYGSNELIPTYEADIIVKNMILFPTDDPLFPWDDIDWEKPPYNSDEFWDECYYYYTYHCNTVTKKEVYAQIYSSIHHKVECYNDIYLSRLTIMPYYDSAKCDWVPITSTYANKLISDLYAKHAATNVKLDSAIQRIGTAESYLHTANTRIEKNTIDIELLNTHNGLENMFYKSLVQIPASDVLENYVHEEVEFRFSGDKLIITPLIKSNKLHCILVKDNIFEFVMKVSYDYSNEIRDEISIFTGYNSGSIFPSNKFNCFLKKEKEYIPDYDNGGKKIICSEYSFLKSNSIKNSFISQFFYDRWVLPYTIEFFKPCFSININFQN